MARDEQQSRARAHTGNLTKGQDAALALLKAHLKRARTSRQEIRPLSREVLDALAPLTVAMLRDVSAVWGYVIVIAEDAGALKLSMLPEGGSVID